MKLILSSTSKKLDIKAIYIQASDDKLVPKHVYEVFKRCISNIELYEVNGSHLLLQGNPVECARMVEKFIEEKVKCTTQNTAK